MTGCLYQRGDVYYVRIKYYDEDKKLREKWVSTGQSGKRSRHKAEVMMEEILEKHAYLEKSNHPRKMSEYLKMWMADQEGKVAQSTYEGYITYFNVHMIPYFEKLDINIQDITPGTIQDYVEYLGSDKGRKDHRAGGQSPSSIRKILSLLRRVLDYAVLYEDIKVNPAIRIPLPKKKKDGEDDREVFLTAEEAQQMLDALQGEEIGPIVFTTLYYGLRKSEALGLRWSAVDFDKNTISINHVVVKNRTIMEKDTTKSYSSRRTYELMPEVRKILLELQKQQAEYKDTFGSGYKENDYIFKWEDGTPYRPDTLTRSFQRALERNGFKKMRFHDLRHSTASILVDKGWDINDIKEWLGHADIETTANIYAHISHKRKVSLANDFGNTLKFTI